MSNTEQNTEQISGKCIVCNYLKEGMQKFPCSHIICKECLCLILIESEFDHENITSNITFYCPACLPNYESIEQSPSIILSYSDITNIFSNTGKSPLKCPKHPNEELKYYCEACNDELCEECKNIDIKHNTSQIELEEIKGEEAEKLIENQILNIDDIKNKIEENKKKVSQEINQSAEKIEFYFVEVINELNKIKTEYTNICQEKEKIINDYFDMMTSTYEKYYTMINSSQISLKTIKSISSMKNILNINILQNNTFQEKLDSFYSSTMEQINEIKSIFPLNVEMTFKEGLNQSGNCITFKTGHKELMTGGILINSGNNLITTSTDNTLVVYEKKLEGENKVTFNEIKKVTDTKIIATNLLSLNKDYFIVGYDNGLIKVWRTEDFDIDKIFTGHISQINKIIKESDNTFISCSDDMTIRGWTLDTLEADSIYMLTGHEDKINDIIIISDNTTLLSVSDDKTLRIWSLELKECINAIKLDEIQTCLSYLNNGRFMTGGEDGSVTIYNIEGFEPSLIFNAHNEPIEVLYLSPFTGDIITGSQDNLVKIFKSDNGTCVKILEGHKNTVLYITQLNENTILTTSVDKTVKIWNI